MPEIDLLIRAQVFLKSGHELYTIPIMLFFCLLLGYLAKKIRLPSILGYIAGGVLVGEGVLDIVSVKTSETMKTIDHIALGLVSLTIGMYLNFYRLRHASRRLIFCAFFDITLPFIFVYCVVFYLFDQPLYFSLLLGAISVSTAPATTIAIIKENKAKGTLINTLLPLVAINNVACIILFGLAVNFLRLDDTQSYDFLTNILLSSLYAGKELLIALCISVIMGVILIKYDSKSNDNSGELLTGLFFLIMAAAGISTILEINPMLSALFLGIFIANFHNNRNKISKTFEDIQHIVLILFFGIAGTHVHFSEFSASFLIIFAFFFARLSGKYIAAVAGGLISRSPVRITKYLGFTTIPQAGVAIGLLILALEIPQLSDKIALFSSIIIISVNVNEFFGPILTKFALDKSGESGQDRTKLIEFLGEEYIHPNLKSKLKLQAIEELVTFLVKTHNLPAKKTQSFIDAVVAREQLQPTGLEQGVAVPHGIIQEGTDIIGVMGLSKQGLDFQARDKKPVHLLILLLTPKELASKHLKVMAEMLKLVENKKVQDRIFNANSAADIYEAIKESEMVDFNYFLDEEANSSQNSRS